MPVDLAGFRARFPEFDSVADAVVQAEIDETVLDLDEAAFGDNLDRATLWLSAHRIAASYDSAGSAVQGQTGALSSASADGVSSSYAMPEGLSAADLDLWSTRYGQRYLQLRNLATVGAFVVC